MGYKILTFFMIFAMTEQTKSLKLFMYLYFENHAPLNLSNYPVHLFCGFRYDSHLGLIKLWLFDPTCQNVLNWKDLTY